MTSLFSARRTLIAAAIVIMLGGGGIAVVGTAAADEPVGLSLPPRHAGDRVEYSSSRDRDGELRYYDTVEQLALFPWKDGEGSYHLADGLVQRMVWRDNGFDFYSFLHVDGQPLSASQGGGLTGGSAGGLLGEESTMAQTSHLVSNATVHLCGFVNSLQGGPASTEMATVGTCSDGLPVTFDYEGQTTWRDGAAYLFESNDTRLWFVDTVPYPVRLEQGDLWIEMEGFSRGDEPLRPVDLPPDTPMPAVEPAARPTQGIDMRGVDFPYPMDRAIREALEDPTFEDLREYLAAHPDAQIVGAEHDGTDGRQVWYLKWADRESSLHLFIERQRGGAWQLLYEELGHDPDAGWRFTRVASEFGHGFEGQMPKEAPPLRDVVAAWQVYTEQDVLPRVVGFYSSDGDLFHVYAGAVGSTGFYQSDPFRVDVLEPSETTEEGHTLHYDQDGELSSIAITQRSERRGGLLADPPESSGDALASHAGSAWAPPPAQTAAGIGIGALLVGAGYLLWPAIKGIPVLGLRWRRPSILDHPVRRRVRDIVCAQPGIHYQAIVKQTGIGKGSAEHHLHRLVAAGELTRVANDGYTCYFPKGTDHRTASAAGALKSPGAQKVMEAIHSNPGAAVTEIAAATGLSPGTVSHHLRRMRERGLVESWRDGKTVRLRAGAVALIA